MRESGSEGGNRMGAWRSLLPEAEQHQYEKGGFGLTVDPGDHPALLVVDMTPLMYDEKYAMAPEGGARDTVLACERLVTYARANGWPVIWTGRSERRLPAHLGGLVWKTGTVDNSDADVFEQPLVPLGDELVVLKPKPSAFFESPLRSQLTFLGVDTLIICGMSTSGCVRATVVDAYSCNYRLFLVEEATADRSAFAHNANLLDINMKYASVVSFETLTSIISPTE